MQYFFALFLLFINSIISITPPVGAVANAAYNNLPLKDKGGTILKVTQRLGELKNPIPAIKANYHKNKMFEHANKAADNKKIPSNSNVSPSSSFHSAKTSQSTQTTGSNYINNKIKDHTQKANEHKAKYAHYSAQDKKIQQAPSGWQKAKNAVVNGFNKLKGK